MPEQFNGARPQLSPTGDPRPNPHVEPIKPSVPDVQVIPPQDVQVLTPAPAKPSPVGNAIKIAGLGNLVQGVRDQISGLRSELPALGQSIQDLRSSVADVKAQVDAVHDDLKFEAQTLGN